MIQPENHFNEELTRYQRDCESVEKLADLEDERIAHRVEELLALEGDCYPWSSANIFEAFTNMGEDKERTIADWFNSARKLPYNANAQKMFTYSTATAILSYWYGVAQAMAEDGR